MVATTGRESSGSRPVDRREISMVHRLRIPAAGVGRTTDELLFEYHRRARRRNVHSAIVSDGALVIVFSALTEDVEKRARYIFCDVTRWPNNSSAVGKYEVVSERVPASPPVEPVLPLPNDKFDGGTVIASVWLRDEEPPITGMLMLLRPQPPHYEIADIEWVGDAWSVYHRIEQPNINPATKTFAEQGGDY